MTESIWAGQDELPPMIWIGGLHGAGKSTTARAIAQSYDLPLHRIDSFSYAHAERLPAGPSSADALRTGPEAAADDWDAHCRNRLPLILADIRDRGLGGVPALVEGPQLTPALADAAGLPAGCAVWLLTGAERTRRVREQRLESARDPAAADRLDRLAAREAVVAARLRRALAATGRPALEVAAEPDWMHVTGAVAHVLDDALDAAPRLVPGERLRDQRRFENAAASGQLRSHLRAIGREERVAFRFACECGRSGCDLVWEGTPDEYAVATAADAACAPPHR